MSCLYLNEQLKHYLGLHNGDTSNKYTHQSINDDYERKVKITTLHSKYLQWNGKNYLEWNAEMSLFAFNFSLATSTYFNIIIREVRAIAG